MRSPNGGIDERSKEYARSTHFIRDEDHFTNAAANRPGIGRRLPDSLSRRVESRAVWRNRGRASVSVPGPPDVQNQDHDDGGIGDEHQYLAHIRPVE